MRRFASTLFPPVCVVCDRYADYFCSTCQDRIDFLYYQPQFSDLKDLVDELFILGFFTPPLSTTIKALKYQSLHPLGPILGDLLYRHLPFPNTLDFVTAVPLHPKRQRQRGYNQAELIARQLAAHLNLPYQPALLRQRHTQNLASTGSQQERAVLMTHIFIPNPAWETEVRGATVLVVDDVVTTGATLVACSQALKQSQAKTIFAVAVAHGG